MTFPIRISMDAKLSVYELLTVPLSQKGCITATGIGEDDINFENKTSVTFHLTQKYCEKNEPGRFV